VNGHSTTGGGGAAADGAATPPPTPTSDELQAARAAASTTTATAGGGKGEGEASSLNGTGREGVKEVKTDFADSDDEIPLPEGVPGFEALEEAMLVRELTKDRLPGKIVRGSDGSGNMVSLWREYGEFMAGTGTWWLPEKRCFRKVPISKEIMAPFFLP